MATRRRTQLKDASGAVLGDIEPPPSKILTFMPQWIRWLYNLYEYAGIVNENFLTVEDWTAVSFTGTWVNYTGGNTAYYIDPYGVVHVRLACKSGTGAIFTLPSGYRPTEDIWRAVAADGAFGEVSIIASTGVVSQTVGTAVNGVSAEIIFRI